MAYTPVHGKDAYFSVTTTTGGTVACSSGLDDSSLQRSVDTAEVTAYGHDDKVYLPGLRDATIPVSGHWASTFDTKFHAMLGHSTGTTWVWGPAGNSTGKRKYTGKGIITKLDVSAPVSDKVGVAMQFQGSGPITVTTF